MDEAAKNELNLLSDEALEGIAGGELDEACKRSILDGIQVFKKMGWSREEMLEYYRVKISDEYDWKDEWIAYMDDNWDLV